MPRRLPKGHDVNVGRLLWIGAGLMLIAVPAAADKPVAGVEAGVSFSRISPDAPGQTISRRSGALAGVYVLFPTAITKTIGLQIEAIYNQKNSRIATPDLTVDRKIDYVAVPILAKLPLFKGIYMLEGISLGVPVKARLRTSAGVETDIKPEVTSPDVALVIGGGVPARRAGIEFRYDGGFKRVSKVESAALQWNRSLSGLIRIRF
jgi:hypothetical protein